MHLYNLSIASLALFTIFLRIVPTVQLTFLSASTHSLEDFAPLCIITPHSLSIQTQTASKGSHDTFILLKYL